MLKGRGSPTQLKGQLKEQLAEQYLRQQGLTLETKNFRCKLGEIDLIMRHGNTRVFVEVRYRKSAAFGSPMESVNLQKQQKLARAAQLYLMRQADADRVPCRFDVIAITGEGNSIDWVRDAFGN